MLFGGPCEGQSKNWDMPLRVACARYSLVKGERIVRFALTTRLVNAKKSGSAIYNASIVFSGKRYGTIRLLVVQKGSLRNWFYSTQAVVCLCDSRGSGEAWGLGRDSLARCTARLSLLTGPRKNGFTSIPRFWVAALVCRNRQFCHDVTEQIDTTTHEEDAKNRLLWQGCKNTQHEHENLSPIKSNQMNAELQLI